MLYLIFSYLFLTNTPCATTSTWDIPSYTTRELLFFPTFSTPVYLFHIQFSFTWHSNNPTSSHLQKKLLPSVANTFRGRANAWADALETICGFRRLMAHALFGNAYHCLYNIRFMVHAVIHRLLRLIQLKDIRHNAF